MKVRIVTDVGQLGEEMVAALSREDREVEHAYETVPRMELRFRPGLELSELEELIAQIAPLQPALRPWEALESDVELRLGDSKQMYSWGVQIYTHDENADGELKSALTEMGLSDHGGDRTLQDENRLEYQNASAFIRQLIRWKLGRQGVSLEEYRDFTLGDTIRIRFAGRALPLDNPKDCELEICGDDLAAMTALQEALVAAGFRSPVLRPLDPAEPLAFALCRGPLPAGSDVVRELEGLVANFLRDRDISPSRFPLELRDAETRTARILLPIAAWRKDKVRPYGGDSLERWEIVLRTDAPAEIDELVQQLKKSGYTPRLEGLPSTSLGFRLQVGAAAKVPELVSGLTSLLTARIEAAMPGARLLVEESLPAHSPRIVAELPLAAARAGSLEGRMRACAGRWNCSLFSPRDTDWHDLSHQLQDMGFASFSHSVSPVSAPILQYGRVPRLFVEHLASLIEGATGQRCELQSLASSGWENNLAIHLLDSGSPEVVASARAAGEVAAASAVDTTSWFAHHAQHPARPLIEVQPDRVRIGHLTLPRRTGGERALVPPPEIFDHYCLEQRTAETLLHVAESVALREPCLLEGETSVSKTSIIQFLAMLLGQPLVRLNLNGQTDTGELVGRFLPHDVTSDLPVTPAQLLASADLLEPESQMILTRAHAEQRELNQVEIQQIMANERMRPHPWRWQDGLVVSAMKEGWWVVLDELNLAEPQILERLNPVLEREPSLVLTEHDNSVIGRGGTPVHPEFRIFATMNPAEYAGRSPLSPAYRDRWRGYCFVEPPTERDYHAMLSFLVSGQQPDVTLRGRKFSGVQQAPAFGMLAEIPGIESFLTSLARFHTALESAVRNPEQHRHANLGVRRQERYIFTRRGLLAVMDCLAGALGTTDSPLEAMRVALLRYYLGRVATPSDKATVARLMDAAGIGLQTWTIDGGARA